MRKIPSLFSLLPMRNWFLLFLAGYEEDSITVLTVPGDELAGFFIFSEEYEAGFFTVPAAPYV